MLEDLTKTVKAVLYDRASSPLLVSFGFSWLAWNYKFLLVITSSMPVLEKFDFIDKTLYPTIWHGMLYGFCWPLTSSLLFLWAYPKPAQVVFRHWKHQQKILKEALLDIEGATPISLEQKNKLVIENKRAADQNSLLLQDISRLNEEIARIRSQLESTTRELTTLQSMPPSPEQLGASQSQISMLRFLANSGRPISEKQLLEEFRESSDPIFDLGELHNMELVTMQVDTSGLRSLGYIPTHEGRRMLNQLKSS